MAFRYAADPRAAAGIAAAMQRASMAKAELEGETPPKTSAGSNKPGIAKEQEQVGQLGEFAKDSEMFEPQIYENAEKAFRFEHEYLNPGSEVMA